MYRICHYDEHGIVVCGVAVFTEVEAQSYLDRLVVTMPDVEHWMLAA